MEPPVTMATRPERLKRSLTFLEDSCVVSATSFNIKVSPGRRGSRTGNRQGTLHRRALDPYRPPSLHSEPPENPKSRDGQLLADQRGRDGWHAKSGPDLQQAFALQSSWLFPVAPAGRTRHGSLVWER